MHVFICVCVTRTMGRVDREMLVVEVWDSDKDMAAPTKVKGIRQ